LKAWTLKDLDIEPDKVGLAASRIRTVCNLAPRQERKGILFEGTPDEAVEKLVDALRKEAVLQ
jgi:electron transfer flavoprotein alpha/beta subunit